MSFGDGIGELFKFIFLAIVLLIVFVLVVGVGREFIFEDIVINYWVYIIIL